MDGNGDFQAFLIFKDLGRSIIHLIATSHFQGSLEKRGNPLGVPHPLNALARYQCVELKFDGYRRHLDWWLPDVYRCLPLGNLDRFSMISRSTNSSKTGEKWDDFFKRVQQQAGISKYFFFGNPPFLGGSTILTILVLGSITSHKLLWQVIRIPVIKGGMTPSPVLRSWSTEATRYPTHRWSTGIHHAFWRNEWRWW